jgi:HNH endonuclease
MKLTPSQVKNLMRRSLWFLIDPDPQPEDRTRCIEFFGNACAYCCESIERGDLDHLVSAAKGGRNHISNRVFACKRCNAEQKRDKDWDDFLAEICGRGVVYDARRARILEWVQASDSAFPIPTATLALFEQAAESATSAYDDACKRIRDGR